MKEVKESYTCFKCGSSHWAKTPIHYMCLDCAELCLHDYALVKGYASIIVEEKTE